jgi:hypothetical protein
LDGIHRRHNSGIPGIGRIDSGIGRSQIWPNSRIPGIDGIDSDGGTDSQNVQHCGIGCILFIAILHIHSADSFVLTNQPICLTTSICPIKCKRYIIRNGCPICECNPCVYGQPLSSVTCGNRENKCLAAGGSCKIDSWYDKPYCCPQENNGCCPPMPVDTASNDPINYKILISRSNDVSISSPK